AGGGGDGERRVGPTVDAGAAVAAGARTARFPPPLRRAGSVVGESSSEQYGGSLTVPSPATVEAPLALPLLTSREPADVDKRDPSVRRTLGEGHHGGRRGDERPAPQCGREVPVDDPRARRCGLGWRVRRVRGTAPFSR